MLLCCLFYLQPLLMWLITPTDWHLAGGRKLADTFTSSLPHTSLQRTSPLPHLENVSKGVCFQSCVFPELWESCWACCCFPAISCSHTLLCINTWELSLSASLRSSRMGAADRSSSVTHHTLHPHVSLSAAVMQNISNVSNWSSDWPTAETMHRLTVW